MKLSSIIPTSYATFRKFILTFIHKHKSPENVNLEAIILKYQRTGRKTSGGDEVKLLLHISPPDTRSYIQEYIDVFSPSEIAHFLQPGQLVKLELDSLTGKTKISWEG